MLRVTPAIAIDESELEEHFVRASGPGGQNVNKVATAVQLRFDVERSPSLDAGVRERLRALAGTRITSDGVLVIDARAQRSQAENRKDARERLIELIRRAAIKPKKRRRTRPTAASKERRLTTKHTRSDAKRARRKVGGDE
jgi:ribosome-associated protein